MHEQKKHLLIGIMIAIGIVGGILILALTIYNQTEQTQNSLTAASEETIPPTDKTEIPASETENDTPTEPTSETVPQEEDSATGNAQMDYHEDIQLQSENAKSLLAIDGQEYTIPCPFSQIQKNFTFQETIPETLPGGGFMEIHTVKDGNDTGISFMLANTTDTDIATEDAYISSVILTSGSGMTASCLGIHPGSPMGDIKTGIEDSGYSYEVSAYDYEQYFRVAVTDTVSIFITYDTQESFVTKIILEYVIF